MKSPFKYVLRFCSDPGFNEEKTLDVLDKYIDEALIDDVMVFTNVEEINTGHTTFAEQDIYIEMLKKIKAMLLPKGVTFSINQWHTLMHADLGKQLQEGQNFRLMVDPYGNKASLCVCPLCENWRSYIAELYARYAKLEPDMLWVEDDFRLHNHEPLIWGGCFCDEHMKLYSKLAGKELTRQEFVEGILKQGEVHPYRKIWLDVSRQTMIDNAKIIGDAVHSVSKSVRVGLMSSAPYIHAAEGRDWFKILYGLSGENQPIDRIHLPGYVEPTSALYMMNFNSVSMLTRAMIPRETQVYPELENFPYSRFSKSRRFTRFQLLSAMPLDLSGMTFNIYDLNGNGIVWEEHYQETLKDAKPYLNRLTQSKIFKQKEQGVHVMFNEKSSYTLFTKDGKSMEELYPQEMFFEALLRAFGIPCTYCNNPDISGEIVAVSGQYLRNLSKSEIVFLIENNYVILDGTAAMTIYDMGLGELINIKSAHWEKQNDGTFSYEQVSNNMAYCGIENARSSTIIFCSDALSVTYNESAVQQTNLYNSYRQKTLNGVTLAKENVLVYPFGNFENLPEIPHMLLNSVRQSLMQNMIANAGEQYDIPPFVINEAYVNPYYYKTQNGFALYIVNAGSDDVQNISININNRKINKITAISSIDNKEAEVNFSIKGQIAKLELPIQNMETALIYFE